MAITTTNGKLAIMELDLDWEPGLPLSPGSLGQDDQQQLLWGFPEILWEEEVESTPAAIFRSIEPGRVFYSHESGRVFHSHESGRVFKGR